MSAAFVLFRLQQTDTRIDQAQNRLTAIRQILENDDEMRQAISQLASAKSSLHEAEHTLRERESEVQAQRLKIEQTSASLYGGSVRNPKELQDLQNELAALKRHLAALEDLQLESMMAVEESENAHKAAQDQHDAALARLSDQNHNLTEEMASLNHDLERLHGERQAALTTVPAALVGQYETIRQSHRGVALVSVSDNACAVCGNTLTAAIQQAARSPAQVALCPSCGRILFTG